MRILHLLSSTGFHGSESMTAELVRQLAPLGIESHIGIFDNAGRGDQYILTAAGAALAGSVVLPCARQFDPRTVTAIRLKGRARLSA